MFSNGKVTVPAPVREECGMSDGDLVEIDVRPVHYPKRDSTIPGGEDNEK